MNSLALALLSLVSAHTPFRLNTEGQGSVDGLNITIGKNDVLTTSNGTSLVFWLEEDEGEEAGTYFFNAGGLVSVEDGYLTVGEEGAEPFSFSITNGELSFLNSTNFWVCPDSNGDLAFSEQSEAPCENGVSVKITAVEEDEDVAIEEYEAAESAASNSTESATASGSSGSASGSAAGSATSGSAASGSTASTSAARSANSDSATSGSAASGSATSGAGTAAAANAAVAIVPGAIFAAAAMLV